MNNSFNILIKLSFQRLFRFTGGAKSLTLLVVALIATFQIAALPTHAAQELASGFGIPSDTDKMQKLNWDTLIQLETSLGYISVLLSKTVPQGEQVREKRVTVVPTSESICFPFPNTSGRTNSYESYGSSTSANRIWSSIELKKCTTKECQLKYALLRRKILVQAILKAEKTLKTCINKPVVIGECSDLKNRLELVKNLLRQPISEASSDFMRLLEAWPVVLKNEANSLPNAEKSILRFDLERTSECGRVIRQDYGY